MKRYNKDHTSEECEWKDHSNQEKISKIRNFLDQMELFTPKNFAETTCQSNPSKK